MPYLHHILSLLPLVCFVVHSVPAAPLPMGGGNYCGGELARALAAVCVKFNSHFSSKVYKGADAGPSITEECCRSSCSYETLSLYCSVAKNLTAEQKEQRFDPHGYPLTKSTKPAEVQSDGASEPKTAEEDAQKLSDDYDGPEPEFVYIYLDSGPLVKIHESPDSATVYFTRSFT